MWLDWANRPICNRTHRTTRSAPTAAFIAALMMLMTPGCGNSDAEGNESARESGGTAANDENREVAQAPERVVSNAISSPRGVPAGTPAPDSLVENAASTVGALASGDPDEFREMLREQGVELNDAMRSEQFAERWLETTGKIFAQAEIDPDGVRVIRPRISGEYVHPVPGLKGLTARRDAGRSFLSEYSSGELETVQLVLPGRYPALSGNMIEATVVIEFTLNPRSQRWVLTEMQTHGVPNDEQMAPLSL